MQSQRPGEAIPDIRDLALYSLMFNVTATDTLRMCRLDAAPLRPAHFMEQTREQKGCIN